MHVGVSERHAFSYGSTIMDIGRVCSGSSQGATAFAGVRDRLGTVRGEPECAS